ncbi:phosphotransferase [Cohnella sp. CFH 77786]|uniref:phosphotransferase n=1 Tax=Cohnella sp. CFH 77786 TaxID=2662265 RepID=UPI001C60A7A8|nr:phosphotransferase [Cohnella sp. CFH 77786]MBW5446318.1 phosphotransferase [Cohnella sp. CFH 77786]
MMNTVRLREIAKPYGLRIARIRSCASLYKSRAAYRLSTDQGAWVLKPFQARRGIGGSAIRQIRRVETCIRRITEQGYPHLSKWRTTDSGRYWVIAKGRPYYVAEWVEGRPLAPTPSDFAALGKALAGLHSLETGSGTGARLDSTYRQIRGFQATDRLFRGYVARIRAKRASERQWFDAHGRATAALSRRAWEMLKAPAVRQLLSEEKPRFIHGDVTIPNVIVAQDGVKLIDWDFARCGSASYELAKTMANTADFDLVRLGALLRGYEEIRPLKPAERQLVAALFRMPREIWQAARNAALGKRNPIFPIVKRTWTKRLAAVKWMDEWAGQDNGGS